MKKIIDQLLIYLDSNNDSMEDVVFCNRDVNFLGKNINSIKCEDDLRSNFSKTLIVGTKKPCLYEMHFREKDISYCTCPEHLVHDKNGNWDINKCRCEEGVIFSIVCAALPSKETWFMAQKVNYAQEIKEGYNGHY